MPFSDNDSLLGAKAIVTGAGRGLGRGLALALSRLGARVVTLDLDAGAAEETLNLLQEQGGAGFAYHLDVTDDVQVARVMEHCFEAMGGIDLLVNNAGVLSVVPVLDMEVAEWQKVLSVNATGVFLCSRSVARLMVDHDIEGSIVSISSIAGKVGDPGLAHYSASKFAVVGFTQSLARELAPHGITVNAICPGVVMTPMIEDLARDWETPVEEMVRAQAIKRPQTPDEIAAAVHFLHTVRSVTGQAINVDGGTVFH